MEPHYQADHSFDKIDFTLTPPEKGEYEQCTFINCDLSQADLSDTKFIDCTFSGCNLSLARFKNTTFFQSVQFRDCKMLGLRFDQCSRFGFAIAVEQCNLSSASFYQLKLGKIVFKNVQLHEADFTECDLSGAVFDHCDLAGATFEQTILEKADFRTAFNFSIDPATNRIKKARFSLAGLPGLLGRYDIEIDG